MKRTTALALVLSAMFFGSSANAAIITYTGSDDGAPVGGPFPNSAAAEANFLAAAGSVTHVDFESVALGYYTPISVPGASISLSDPNYGDGFSGISQTNFGNLYGFDTTLSGRGQWLGFPTGSATFNFDTPIEAFGTYITGLQTVFTSSITIGFSDGTSQILDLPINVNGGAQYFGFTDIGASIISLTITNLSDDAWGIDDLSFTGNGTPAPEPMTLSLVGAGIAGIGALRRRKSA